MLWDQLQQVILNLLRNASDAMNTVNDRTRELLIKTARDEGDRVRLSVIDAGLVSALKPPQNSMAQALPSRFIPCGSESVSCMTVQ
jgi:hypothetical protein